MTLNELTDQMLEAVRPEVHDDDVLDRRLIKALIHNQRAVWIRNELNKNREIPEQVIQDLGCVPLVDTDVSECCDFTSGCLVRRTAAKIPIPIALHHREAIERVGPALSNEKPFSIKSYKEALFFGNSKFNSDNVATYRKNGYLYFVSKGSTLPLLTYVSVRIVASDPTQAAGFNHCTGGTCYNDDMEYPITDWMWQYMKEHIVQELLRKGMVPNDIVNDASHTSPTQNVSK